MSHKIMTFPLKGEQVIGSAQNQAQQRHRTTKNHLIQLVGEQRIAISEPQSLSLLVRKKKIAPSPRLVSVNGLWIPKSTEEINWVVGQHGGRVIIANQFPTVSKVTLGFFIRGGEAHSTSCSKGIWKNHANPLLASLEPFPPYPASCLPVGPMLLGAQFLLFWHPSCLANPSRRPSTFAFTFLSCSPHMQVGWSRQATRQGGST